MNGPETPLIAVRKKQISVRNDGDFRNDVSSLARLGIMRKLAHRLHWHGPRGSLGLDTGDPDVFRPLGALLAVLCRALLEAERLGGEGELVDQPVVDRGRADGLVDQRV